MLLEAPNSLRIDRSCESILTLNDRIAFDEVVGTAFKRHLADHADEPPRGFFPRCTWRMNRCFANCNCNLLGAVIPLSCT